MQEGELEEREESEDEELAEETDEPEDQFTESSFDVFVSAERRSIDVPSGGPADFEVSAGWDDETFREVEWEQSMVGSEPPATSVVYTKLDAPAAVQPGETFEVVIGLTALAPDEPIEPIEVPQTFTFSMFVRTGFDWVVGNGDIVIEVDLANEIPQRVITLKAGNTNDEIEVLYFVEGRPVGSVLHPVSVGADPDGSEPVADRSRVHFDRSADLDFVLHVTRYSGELQVDAYRVGTNDHWGKSIVMEPPKSWFNDRIKSVPVTAGGPMRVLKMRGVGRDIANLLPDEFVEAVLAFGGEPRVLILSQDPYIPWELAFIGDNDDERSCLLGATAVVGRWPIGAGSEVRLPPADKVGIDQVVIMTAEYPHAPLAHADSEATALASQWSTTRIDGTSGNAVALLEGAPEWQALHVALHGKNRPGSPVDGLELVDGQLDAGAVKGATHVGPLVMLNACEVGGGTSELGAWSGLPAAFASSGAVAIVAPLWAIRDDVAGAAAVEFYETCVDHPPAEALRRFRERFEFDDSNHDTSLTWLAYQFFGHPALRFQLTASTNDDDSQEP